MGGPEIPKAIIRRPIDVGKQKTGETAEKPSPLHLWI